MKNLRPLAFCITLFLSGTAFGQDSEDGFRPLFNGKDLTDWVVVNTAPSTWHFDEDGVLNCSGKPIGEIRTERMYQNFILEIEWRHLKPKGNAGIFVWADDITARGQPFHRGIEVQVLENAYGDTQSHTTHGDIFPIHGATMTPVNGRGESRAFPTESRSKPSPEWNQYRIVCNDGQISLAVNGKVVTRGQDCVPRKGYLCLESEGGIVQYRNGRIKELPDTPIDPDQVAIANRGYRSLYTGVDLSGWKPAEGWEPKDWVLASAQGAKPLVSDGSFTGDVGFVVDFRRQENSGSPRIEIGGMTIALDPANADVRKALEPEKKWNRLEGSLKAGAVSLELNGTRLEASGSVTGAPKTGGPLCLIPDGPIDWANIYVRD